MGGPVIWVTGIIAALLVIPPIVVAFNEKRLRRRHRALASRRKGKIRL